MDITTTPAWSAALDSAASISQTTLKDLFARDASRAETMSVEVSVGKDALLVDFSKHNIDANSVQRLIAVAEQAGVEQLRNDMFSGVVINGTEHQPALHTALRAPLENSIKVDGVDVMKEIHRVRTLVNDFAESVRAGSITGATGKKFQSVINVGIGGSDLGPTLVYEALSSTRAPAVRVHFVSNIDPTDVRAVLQECDPETTLVVLCSKSFSTAETLSNGRIIAQWISDAVGAKSVSKHFAVVSVFPEKAASVGLSADYAFPMWSWVGGRYSISSAVNLVNVIAFGSTAYDNMLAGMRSMDEHFLAAPLHRNAPVLMGLLNVWNRSLLGRETRAMIAYSTALKSFASYVQQLEMESNGKRVTADGQPVSISTSPIVWGGVGTNAQHAYMQLLHQGTSVVPADFIGVATTPTRDNEAHDALVANLFAQTQALAFGSAAEPHRTLPGNRPSTTLMLSALTPHTLGALIALYEHSVFVQGCVFGVNSFDQWGVELGKKLATEVSAQISAPSQTGSADASTAQLVQWYKSTVQTPSLCAVAEKYSQAERMINLLALLVQRSKPMTLKQIRQDLVGQYPESDTAARAAFERDKGDLRALGIPIELITLGGDQAGEGAYRVDRKSFELGDLGLTDDERAALQFAMATVRVGASHGDEALWKLGGERALNAQSTSLNIQLDDELMTTLADGVLEHRTLTFSYKGETRNVDPYGLLARAGFWYLVGYDHLRADRRTFRIDRIDGEISVGERKSFNRPKDFDLQKAVPTEAELLAEGHGEDAVATVLVDASLANGVRTQFGKQSVIKEHADGGVEFAIPCANLTAFRVWLFAMVDNATVIGPPRVRKQVVSWLTEQAGGR